MRSSSASLLGLVTSLLTALSAVAADLPEGPGRDIVQSACTTCHTADRIVALKQTEAGWRITVRQMEEEGASFNPSDIEPIVAYLVKYLGVGKLQPVDAGPEPAALAPSGAATVSFIR